MKKSTLGAAWRDSKRIRHAWMLDDVGPYPVWRQVYIIDWHQQAQALVAYAVEIKNDPGPTLIQRWVVAGKLRPVRTSSTQIP